MILLPFDEDFPSLKGLRTDDSKVDCMTEHIYLEEDIQKHTIDREMVREAIGVDCFCTINTEGNCMMCEIREKLGLESPSEIKAEMGSSKIEKDEFKSDPKNGYMQLCQGKDCKSDLEPFQIIDLEKNEPSHLGVRCHECGDECRLPMRGDNFLKVPDDRMDLIKQEAAVGDMIMDDQPCRDNKPCRDALKEAMEDQQ